MGSVARNVADAVSLPRGEQHEEMQTWTTEQARSFMAVTSQSSYGPLWMVLLATGMRCGEALGHGWKDVDFEGRTLKIRRTVELVGNRPVFQPPKTRNGYRDVPVPAAVIDALREHKRKQNERRLMLGTA